MKDRVYRIVSQVLGVDVSTITDETSPDTEASWDSLKHMNLVLSLEQEFDVQFDDQQTVEMMSVGLIMAILKDVLESGQP